MVRTSRFVYDRSVTDDMACVLAAARCNVWCEPQRIILDVLIRDFMDVAFEHDQEFDTERFATKALYQHDRCAITDPNY